jgi:hypothetical protein
MYMQLNYGIELRKAIASREKNPATRLGDSLEPDMSID